MAKLFHPDATSTSCSWGGTTYVRAEDGSFEVPNEAFAELQFHGFTLEAPVIEAPQAPVVEAPRKKGGR